MTDTLEYIDRELQYIRSLAGGLAVRRLRMSSRLGLSGTGESSDPHVERLIDAFAVLTGRIRRKIDDELPEFSDALLSSLYPHYLAPIPSMSIVQFKLSAAQAEQVNGYQIPARMELESEPVDVQGSCTYQTCSPVRIWPIDINAATLLERQTKPPGTNLAGTGLLRINLNCLGNGKLFSALKIPKLRFYIAGQDHYAFALYELVLNGTLNISITNGTDAFEPRWLGTKALSAGGFDAEDAIFPPDPRTFPGYRLLSEYFAFPRKFLFFDVNLEGVALDGIGSALALQFHLEKSASDIEPHVSGSTFKLGCAPVVNLVARSAEPIDLTQTRSEYPVEVYSPQMQSFEIHQIQSVTALSPDGQSHPYAPFYSARHGALNDDQRFWHATRRPAEPKDDRPVYGTDMFISLVDLGFNPSSPPDWRLKVEVLCTNRDLPKRLPTGEGRPRFTLVRGGVPSIHTVVAPTHPLRPPMGRGVVWGLVSHLLLNHLSLCDGTPDGLREMLNLYNIGNSAETRSKIEAIAAFSSEPAVARVGSAAGGGFCQGLRITLLLDELGFVNKDAYLFASVLERFLGSYVSINSFAQLVLKIKQRNSTVRQWPPRAGQKVLL